MDCNSIKPGLRVSITRLETTTGILVKPNHLEVRRVGAVGAVMSYVPGHGGDVWWVQHDGTDEVGAYMFTEFEPAPETISRLDLLRES